MVRYARMVPKICVHSLFSPNFPVEFVALTKKYLASPTVEAAELESAKYNYDDSMT